MTRAVERLTTGVQGLADLLGLDAPVLPTAASLGKSGLQIVNTTSSFAVREDGTVPGGIWDDDEERRFYEDLPDLLDLVPPTLLGVKDKKPEKEEDEKEKAPEGETAADAEADAEAQKRDEEDIRRQLEQMALEGASSEEEAVPMDRNDTAISDESGPAIQEAHEEEPQPAADGAADEELQSGPAARLTALFAALPEAVNREMIDKLAIEFAFLNSKAARRRLIKVSCGQNSPANISSSALYRRAARTFFPTTLALWPFLTSTCPTSARALSRPSTRRCATSSASARSASWTASV
jgi:regulator of nonsense transcripts 2